MRPPSPEIHQRCTGSGAESNTDSLGVEDSRDEWNKTEVSVWSCCPTPTTKVGLTLAEVHITAQEDEMLKKQDQTWEDMVSKQLPGGVEEEDWGREEGGQPSSEVPV